MASVMPDDPAAAARADDSAQGLRRRRRRRRGAPRRDDRVRARRVHGDHGPVGLGQVHAAALPGRPRHADRRARCSSATSTSPRSSEKQLTAAAARQGRVRLPGVQPDPHADRGGEHHAAAGHRRARRRSRVVRQGGRHDRAARSARPPADASSRAASSSGSPAPGRWCRRPEIVFADEPTGQPRLAARARSCWGSCATAVDDHGQTIVMVTHDANAASYADRVVFLADGRVVDEMRDPTAERVLDRLKSLEA